MKLLNMDQEHDIFFLLQGALEVELNYRTKTAYFQTESYEVPLNYWQFGALIKELEEIRWKMAPAEPNHWSDMFTSGLD